MHLSSFSDATICDIIAIALQPSVAFINICDFSNLTKVVKSDLAYLTCRFYECLALRYRSFFIIDFVEFLGWIWSDDRSLFHRLAASFWSFRRSSTCTKVFSCCGFVLKFVNNFNLSCYLTIAWLLTLRCIVCCFNIM